MKVEWRELLIKLGILKPAKIMYIGGSEVLPPPLKPAEEQTLIEALMRGEEAAKQKLIEHNLRLVVYIARRFENTGINIEDLISIGTIGLIKAVGTFKADKKIKLATYSSRCIENEILMYIRKISGQKTEVSLDEPINTDWDGNELLLSDVLGTDGDTVMRPMEEDVDHQLLRQALERLPEREKTHRPNALRPGRTSGKDPERGGGSDGDFPILHLPPGKANYGAVETGDLPADL